LDFYSAISLKQHSTDRHVSTLRHIILILDQPVFALSPQCCLLSGEAAQCYSPCGKYLATANNYGQIAVFRYFYIVNRLATSHFLIHNVKVQILTDHL
jgi:hypothetical protein